MFGLGMSEIIFLAILALIVIGPKELPELARTLGRFLNELKRSSSALTDDLKQQARLDLLDLDVPLKPRRRPDDEASPGAPPSNNVKFSIKPEPQQLAFDDNDIKSDDDRGGNTSS